MEQVACGCMADGRMDMKESTRALEDLLRPTVEALGCRIWGIERFGQPRRPTLRIYIDREEGVTLDDCERVSRQVSAVLDVEDPIASAYVLEVSSPGVDRVLFHPEHFAECIGEEVEIRLFAPLDGRRQHRGELVAFEAAAGANARVTLATGEGENVEIDLDAIAKAQVVPSFD